MNAMYDYENAMAPEDMPPANAFWVDLNEVDLSEGSGMRFVDPKPPAMVGDVSTSFQPVNP